MPGFSRTAASRALRNRWSLALVGVTYAAALLIGVLLGSGLAGVRNFDTAEELDVTLSALPTQLFDIKGRLITEFFSDEKREIVSLDEVPRNLINAVLTREDHNFYRHRGLDPKRIVSAALGYFFWHRRKAQNALASSMHVDAAYTSLQE